MKRVYMDHSATTPLDPRVLKAMEPYLTEEYGNPSSIHRMGQIARNGVETAREQVARLINAAPEEIIFTSGGTEADNLAILGLMEAMPPRGQHIITSAIEHHAVLDVFAYLERKGYQVTFLPVNEYGMVEPETLERAMKPNTALVSIMHANNEIGTIQPIKKLAAIAHEGGAVFHTDAVQTVGRIPVDVKDMGVDMLSCSAHKLYGPKGVGCLYKKKGIRLARRLFGGAQERKLRSGTENVPGIVGFGAAAEIAGEVMSESIEHLTKLGRNLSGSLLRLIPDTILTGDPVNRLPGHVSLCFRYVEGESILLMLDQLGIMASSGSACTSGSLDPSHVLLAIGLPHEIAHGSVRLSLGRTNTQEDVDYVVQVLPGIIERLRMMSPMTGEGVM
ncbi:MAG: cysteine desulfurase NifS [Syntrophomonadaceae bacterium]|nr:cysteine desulfurase NifS [Syntrophomonadaceae bacterium]